MNIAEIIGWKFNHQSGMRCREVNGIGLIANIKTRLKTSLNE